MSNFNKNNTKMFSHTKQRWGLRKLSVGVASVLLGFTFLGVQSQQALADTNTATGNVDVLATTANQQISGNQVVLAAGQEATTVNQIPVVPNSYANAMNGFRPENGNTQAIINSSTDAIKENGGDLTTKFNQVGAQTDSNGNMSVTMSASNYKSNPADAAETVDLQNLTSTQQNEITTFAAQVINQIRSEVQAQSNGKNVSAGFLKVSPFATQAGNSIVHAAYDNFTGEGHNMAGLGAAAKNLGINSWVGENIGGLLTGTALEAGWVKTITMDQLKNDIYLSILSMMYVDNNSNSIGAGGHTTALLNDPSYNVNSDNGGNAISLDRNGNVIANQYLALTIDKRNRVHFNFISDAGASADAKAKLAQGAFQPMFSANDHNHGQSSSAESSANSSAESSASSSAESSANSSAESSASSSAESSASGSTESSASSPAESSANGSAESSASGSAESSASSPAESSASSSAESSASSPAESSASSLAESSASSSTESSASSPAESSANSSAESSTSSSAESSANSSAESSASSSAESSANSSAESSASSSAESSASSSAESSASSPAESSVSSSAESSANSSAESSASSPAESSASSSAESSASSSAESSASSPAESSASSSAINTDNIANNATSNVSDGHHVTASRSNVQVGAVNANKKLPQTGNNNEGSLFALAMLVLSTCFGLGLRKKRD